MYLRLVLFVLPFLLLSLCSADPIAQPTQISPGIIGYKDIAYVPNGDPAQKLDLYVPQTPTDKPLPLVIWIHGGGWEGGSKDYCTSLYLVGQGYAAASIEYRFSQKAKFPAQIQDCQAAIRWLRANSKLYNIDPNEFGVWGNSAGGHLVALLGTSGGKNAFRPIGGNLDQSDRVQAVCDEYGPADFNTVMAQAAADQTKNVFPFNHDGDPYSALLGVPLNSDIKKGNAASPVFYVSRDNPPFLILHGTKDPMVPYAQSTELTEALHKAHVNVLLQSFPGATHVDPIIDQNPSVHALVKTFFDNHLCHQHVNVELLPLSEVTTPPAVTP
jgi:acetyl esterase/lipase